MARKLPPHMDLDRADGVLQIRRHFASPNAGAQGTLYDNFRQDYLWAMLLRYGDRVEWEPRGISSWRYDQSKGSYTMEHRYLLRTPELQADAILVATSELVQDESGATRREWRIEGSGPNGTRLATDIELTDYGRRMRGAMQEANHAFGAWIGNVVIGNKEAALATTESKDPKKFEELYDYMRAGAPPGEHAMGKPSGMLLIRDREEKPYWLFTFDCFAENRQYVLQFRFTLKGNPHGETGDWRVVDPEKLYHAKVQAPEGKPSPRP
jgi:hypothetical protein